MLNFIFAAKVSSVPTWAFGLFTTVMLLLVGIISWFVKREFSIKETEIIKLKNILYGYTGSDGSRRAGIMEQFEDHIQDYNRLSEKLYKWESEIEEKQQELLQFQTNSKNNMTDLRRRVESSENWLREESERNRKLFIEINERSMETRDQLLQIRTKLDTLLELKKDRR